MRDLFGGVAYLLEKTGALGWAGLVLVAAVAVLVVADGVCGAYRAVRQWRRQRAIRQMLGDVNRETYAAWRRGQR
jgi:hypothetical protein